MSGKASYDKKTGVNADWRKEYTRGPRGKYGSRPDSPGDPEAPSCRGFGSRWLPDGTCPECGRHWTCVYQTRDAKRNPFRTNGKLTIPSHKTKPLKEAS
ncbi:gp83 [Mycobacterium phage Troll4]|uniref:Uncharacterized protein n=1 Tax=Mycobacterium phage Troll4 TaxID=561999 RepID=B5U449_9CAUD|nr:gp83 [Mycobacterium phage Troll4]ACI06544.1 hypothetical protein TROLL4_83 [Mycobacterium phage Troll4]